MRISRRTGKRLRSRRGATIVLVAMMVVVLIGFVGVGVDFARMYAFKTQLKTVTDASAMAGAIEMMKGRRSNLEPEILALAQRPLNNVDGGNTAEVLSADVDAVVWDFDTRSVTANFGDAYQAPEVNAIRVIGRYPAPFTFGSIFGITTATLVDTTIAALGGIGGTGCVKPWAVPYQNILWSLGRDPLDTAYNLLPEDITDLTQNRKIITFKTTPQSDGSSQATADGGVLIPGNYYAVQYPQAWSQGVYNPNGPPQTGANDYRDQIAGGCLPYAINVGDSLQTKTGQMDGPTEQGTARLCKGTTGTGPDRCPGGGNTVNWCPCNNNQQIQLPIYLGEQDKGGGTKMVHVEYIGSFHLTEFSSNGSVRGYLTSMTNSGGGFVGGVGPVQKGAIVY